MVNHSTNINHVNKTGRNQLKKLMVFLGDQNKKEICWNYNIEYKPDKIVMLCRL